MTGILLWANNLLPRSSNPILNYASSSMSVTLAAQLATAPLIIYYFNSFPTSFFITNFVIVPLLPLILLLNVSAIAIAALGYQLGALIGFIDLLYEYMIQTSHFCINYLPAVNNIWIDGLSATLLSASAIIAGLMLEFSATRILKYTCVALLCAVVASVTANNLATPKSGHFIASEYSSTDIVAFQNDKLYILNSLNDTILAKDFIANADKFLARHRFDSIVYDRDSLNSDGIRFHIHSHGSMVKATFLLSEIIASFTIKTTNRQRLTMLFSPVGTTTNFQTCLTTLTPTPSLFQERFTKSGGTH